MSEFKKQSVLNSIGAFFSFCLILLIAIPVLPFILLVHFYNELTLADKARRAWFSIGKHGVFVYSNSPNWKEYIEADILPKLQDKLIILNWSERSTWKRGLLEVKVFKHWAGAGREYNPIAIVFPPTGKPQVIKFWKAFRDFKHGKDRLLQEQMGQLLAAL